MLFVRTFGDLANFNPHVHVLAADGGFLPGVEFVALPLVPEMLLVESFRHAVLDFPDGQEAISDHLRRQMLGWHYSGFSVHNQVRIGGDDPAGRKRLTGYMIRAPMSLEKMVYDARSRTVIYRSKMHLGLKRNFQVMPGAQEDGWHTSGTIAWMKRAQSRASQSNSRAGFASRNVLPSGRVCCGDLTAYDL